MTSPLEQHDDRFLAGGDKRFRGAGREQQPTRGQLQRTAFTAPLQRLQTLLSRSPHQRVRKHPPENLPHLPCRPATTLPSSSAGLTWLPVIALKTSLLRCVATSVTTRSGP